MTSTLTVNEPTAPDAKRAYSDQAEHYIERIRECANDAILGIIEVGRLCEDFAKKHEGEYVKACSEGVLGFSRQTADKYRKIHEVLGGAHTVRTKSLPPSWGTLYEIAKLDQAKLRRLITDGKITPETTRAEVRKFLPNKSKTKKSRGKKRRDQTVSRGAVGLRRTISNWFTKIDQVREAGGIANVTSTWNQETFGVLGADLETIIRELNGWLEHMRKCEASPPSPPPRQEKKRRAKP